MFNEMSPVLDVFFSMFVFINIDKGLINLIYKWFGLRNKSHSENYCAEEVLKF